MVPYISKSGKRSRVTAYETGTDFIIIEFNYKTKHKYSFESTGSTSVETMKKFALDSQGLSTYISQNSPRYETTYLKIFPFFIHKLTNSKQAQRI